MSIYSGFKNEESFRKNLISNIKKTNYEDLKDKICSRLNYGFSSYDILRIAKAYKQGDKDLNNKIEYVLEDCNFHSECSMLSLSKADELIENTKKEIEDYILKNLTKIYTDEYLANKETRGFIPINSVLVDEWSIEEHEFLVDKGILQKRDCEGYAYELTDSYISKLKFPKELKEGIYEIIPIHQSKNGNKICSEYMNINVKNGTIIYEVDLGISKLSPEIIPIREYEQKIINYGNDNVSGAKEFEIFKNKYQELYSFALDNSIKNRDIEENREESEEDEL